MREILEKRFAGTKKGDNSENSSEEGTPRKQRRTSQNLVAKKRVGGGAKRKSRKEAMVASLGKGKKIPMKAVPSKSDSGRKHGGMLPGVLGQKLVGFWHGPNFTQQTNRAGHLINMGKGSIKKERLRQLRRVVMKSNRNQKKKKRKTWEWKNYQKTLVMTMIPH